MHTTPIPSPSLTVIRSRGNVRPTMPVQFYRAREMELILRDRDHRLLVKPHTGTSDHPR